MSLEHKYSIFWVVLCLMYIYSPQNMSYRHINMRMNLLDLRAEAGLTQKELAIRVGCAQSEISRIEHGERSISVERLQQIAEALRVPVSALLGERYAVSV